MSADPVSADPYDKKMSNVFAGIVVGLLVLLYLGHYITKSQQCRAYGGVLVHTEYSLACVKAP